MRTAWHKAGNYGQWHQRHQPPFSRSLGLVSKSDEYSVLQLKVPRTALWMDVHQRLHLPKNHLPSDWHWLNENTSFGFVSMSKSICLSSIIKINSAVVFMYLDIILTVITEKSVTKLTALCSEWDLNSASYGAGTTRWMKIIKTKYAIAIFSMRLSLMPVHIGEEFTFRF